MPAESIDLRVLADFASAALHFKLIEPAKVVAWADAIVVRSDIPPPWLLDLSLVKQSDPDAVRAVLRAVPGTPDPDLSVSLLSALVLREWRGGRLTIGRVRGIGWQLYQGEFERLDLSRCGVIVESVGEDLDDGRVSEAEMDEVIKRELASFESCLGLLPSWA